MNHFFEDVKGWFEYSQTHVEAIRNSNNGDVFVEVGAWCGRSTVFTAVEIINSGKNITLYAIDTWKGSPEHQSDPLLQEPNGLRNAFDKYIEPVKHVIVPMQMTSKEASSHFQDESVRFIFIDCDHRYECIREDIDLWWPKVMYNGWLSGHDFCYSSLGVPRAVTESFAGKFVLNGQIWTVPKTRW